MKAEKKGKYLYIRLKLLTPRPSSTGKSLLVATTRGPRPTKFKIRGRFVRVIAHAFIDVSPLT